MLACVTAVSFRFPGGENDVSERAGGEQKIGVKLHSARSFVAYALLLF